MLFEVEKPELFEGYCSCTSWVLPAIDTFVLIYIEFHKNVRVGPNSLHGKS